MPVGDRQLWQELIRIRRMADDRYREEDLGGVRFVPLIGAQGWQPDGQLGRG
jgi:protein-L-isoaspartate O-methyltransferase